MLMKEDTSIYHLFKFFKERVSVADIRDMTNADR